MTEAELASRLAALGVSRDEITVRFARASGPGGQHVNKTSTAVTLTCNRLGITVCSQDSRSQTLNRETAWDRLISALEAQKQKTDTERTARREKARRRNRKRPRALKERILETKRRRSLTKRLRGKPGEG